MSRRSELAAFVEGGALSSARRGGTTPEGAVKKQILDGLTAHRVPCWRLGVGAFRAMHRGRARFVRLGDPGVPDLLVFLPGGAGFIEVKSARGKLSPEQVRFRSQCQRAGVAHCVARDWSDVEQWLSANGVER